jgi:hypothetical protein
VALWNVAEGIANLLLSIYWAKKYGLMGIALGTVIPMLVVSTIIRPWYALRVVGLPVRDYLRRALAQPAAVGLLFAVACSFGSGSPGNGTFLYLLWTVAWQTALFGFLAYALGLRSFERKLLRDQGKHVAATLRLVRA